MLKEHENQDDFEFTAEKPPKKNIFPKIIQKYNPFRMRKYAKKRSLFSTLIIIIEISFILFTFFLALKRAIKSVINKKDIPIRNVEKIKNVNIIPDIKVCLCTPAKNENRYIKEFIQFYEKLGVDKIYLYDNNEKDGEKFEDVINDYIKNGLVEVTDWRGRNKQLINMMDDCYQKNYDNYDWLIFYEVDEYIHLKNYTNIKQFLNETKFNKCQKIYLNWVFHTDNDLFHYEDRPVQQRFPKTEPIPENKVGKHNFIKTIIRGHIPNLKIDCIHRLSKNINACNGYGKEPVLQLFKMKEQDFENYYIDHYFCKSVDEFIDKLNRGDAYWGNDTNFLIGTFANYFGYNNMTIEKIEYIQNKTGLNLLSYIKKLNDKNNN